MLLKSAERLATVDVVTTALSSADNTNDPVPSVMGTLIWPEQQGPEKVPLRKRPPMVCSAIVAPPGVFAVSVNNAWAEN